MLVYKLCRMVGDIPFSAVTTYDDKYCIRYEIGKKVVPTIGMIFAFENIAPAILFLGHHHEDDNLALFSAETDAIFNVDKVASPAIPNMWYQYWKSGAYARFKPPSGTVLCPNLTLIARVQ